jgi:hypothetical protein
MANMFKTIEAEGGASGPEWLSSHPNPANRYAAITKEAAMLKVQGKGESGQFTQMQARLGDMGPSFTAEQIAKGEHRTAGTRPTATAGRTVKVEPPSATLRSDTPGQFSPCWRPFELDAPDLGSATPPMSPRAPRSTGTSPMGCSSE